METSTPSTMCSKALVFQQFHVEEAGPSACVKGTPRTLMPDIRMFGRTADGISVCCNVVNFGPVLYAKFPPNFTIQNCKTLLSTLNEIFQASSLSPGPQVGDWISGITIEQTGKCSKVGKFTTRMSCFSAVANFLEGYVVDVQGCPKFTINFIMKSYNFVGMFMQEHGMVGFSWIELTEGSYTSRLGSSHGSRYSTCQLEIDVSADRLIAHAPTGCWSNIVPLKILSVDIECLGRGDIFPEAEHDPVIQISTTMFCYSDSEASSKTLFTLNTCSPIDGVLVKSFKLELQLLEAWAEFVAESDADIITGYNVTKFDLKYLLQRAKILKMESFGFNLGRIVGRESIWFPVFGKQRFSWRQNVNVNIPGRLILDVMLVVADDSDPRNRLQDVCLKYLKTGKENVDYTEIPDLFAGNEETRKILGLYCLKDSLLVMQLIKKLDLIKGNVETIQKSGLQFHEYLCTGYISSNSANVCNHLVGVLKTERKETSLEEVLLARIDHLENDSINVKQQLEKAAKPRYLGMTPRRLVKRTALQISGSEVNRLASNVGFKPPRQSLSVNKDKHRKIE